MANGQRAVGGEILMLLSLLCYKLSGRPDRPVIARKLRKKREPRGFFWRKPDDAL